MMLFAHLGTYRAGDTPIHLAIQLFSYKKPGGEKSPPGGLKVEF
jgi:hypothetical protein